MTTKLAQAAAWLTDQLLCLLVSFLTGIRPQAADVLPAQPARQVYFANHGSHGDFLMVWVSLPRRWRRCVRPVAGADYWLNNRLKRFIIQNVFNGLLIDRHSSDPQAVVAQMSAALQQGDSLILFPEGTRNTDDDTVLLPFKSGLYHLAQAHPEAGLVPIWIDNITRVLPKGKLLPVPLLCQVHIGRALPRLEAEAKDAFLQRSRDALLALAPPEQQARSAQTAAGEGHS